MSLSKDFNDYAKEDREFRGKVLEKLDNMEKHIVAVSQKATDVRKDLDVHKADNKAHGIGAILLWGGALITVGEVAIEVFRRFHP